MAKLNSSYLLLFLIVFLFLYLLHYLYKHKYYRISVITDRENIDDNLDDLDEDNEEIYDFVYQIGDIQESSNNQQIYDTLPSHDTLSNSSSDLECVICHEPLNNFIITKCNHKYHYNCLNQWYSTELQKNNIPTCPICRSNL